ncbi:MAG: ribosome maturation factor RimM [Paracoccaceae bacterium]|nr:MAG: ribosome maturation factor RimM [Alphaproteobacteria bacterium]GIX13701.1 MAG: ribosome maturation factor RimM [Paracoccaceae bacterium]
MAVGDRDRLICVGAIAGAFGVRGEVRVKSFCAEPEAIAGYGPLVTEDGRRFAITIRGTAPGALVCRLSGVETREQAQALKGTRLHVARGRLPDLPEDEFYHADLIGLTVQDTGGAVLGQVRAVHDHGAGDFLEITGPALARPLLLPFTRAFVPTVDLARGRIVVDPPQGSDEAP